MTYEAVFTIDGQPMLKSVVEMSPFATKSKEIDGYVANQHYENLYRSLGEKLNKPEQVEERRKREEKIEASKLRPGDKVVYLEYDEIMEVLAIDTDEYGEERCLCLLRTKTGESIVDYLYSDFLSRANVAD